MNATILMTYRESSPERRKNLLTTVQWLAAEAPQAKLIVLEQDAHPRLTGALPHPNHQILFGYNPHGFNKAWGFNVGARMARTSVLVFTDADLIVSGRLRSMIESCEQKFPISKPYDDVRDLSAAESENMHLGHYDYAPAPSPNASPGREAIGEQLPLCGGMFAIRVDAFFHIGAWDERFVGWGGEDDAMSMKLKRAKMQVGLQPGKALHLWHPRAVEQLNPELYRNNARLLQSICNCSDAQLARMAEVQRQYTGYPEKYRPMESAQ
ncbi:hypothetical protein G7047_21175 [Diaphorobacter sp. HDW4A]|uniref:galactosyltransferase-related protein n=1 Tax=Diaphorobacter sp. HDW4A TaxID=2714924 RepID=UPI00140A3B80|nr:galactosyltransferase-related protein [Diaphorobacter sp. HDW4A]QIL82161.1 hypothetical protein G7047_21175 [Diaphorobacter sp. HDW4A]